MSENVFPDILLMNQLTEENNGQINQYRKRLIVVAAVHADCCFSAEQGLWILFPVSYTGILLQRDHDTVHINQRNDYE